MREGGGEVRKESKGGEGVRGRRRVTVRVKLG